MGQICIPDRSSLRPVDVVVIGGGIVGTATAFWLSKAGLDVTLIEMRKGLSTLTTSASAECFRAQFLEPTMAALAKQSIQMFEHFEDVIGMRGYDISLHQQGYLFMTDDPEMLTDLQSAVEDYHQLGVTDSEFLSGDKARSRFPFISPSVLGATFRQDDGWLSTHEVTQGFAKGCNAKFFVETKANRILFDEEGISGIETNRGSIPTRTIVNAAGPFAREIGLMAGVEIPLELVRLQKAFIECSSMIPRDAPFTVDLVNGSYWRPETGGALLGWVDPNEPPGKPEENVKADQNFSVIVLDKVRRLSPFWGEVVQVVRKRNTVVSAGQSAYTPDSQPLIGPVSEIPGFYLNCGHWYGVMLAPGSGKWVADLITGEMRQEDNPLRVNRFKEEEIKKSKTFLRRH
jgi:sarcosine oxidase subunit beta